MQNDQSIPTLTLETYKIALIHASDHIVLTDPDGTILFANNAVQRITGFAPDEVLGKKAGTKGLWGGLMPTEFYQHMWETIRIKKEEFSGKVQNRRKTGEIYTAKTTITPVLDEHGEILFFIGIEQDMTEQEELDQVKSDFVSLASHQLRTPLTTMRWNLELMLDSSNPIEPNKQHDLLSSIYHQTIVLIQLVNSILNLARIENGTFEIIPEPVNLRSIEEEVFTQYQPQIEKRKLTIESPSEDFIVQADRTIVGLVYQNLLSNAIKYSHPGGKIVVRHSIQPQGSQPSNELPALSESYVRLDIQDYGIGISHRDKLHVFQKLFRSDSAVKHDPTGNGLGLAIVKPLLDANGCMMFYDSVEGQGSTFSVLFPQSGMKAKAGSQSNVLSKDSQLISS